MSDSTGRAAPARCACSVSDESDIQSLVAAAVNFAPL